MRCDTRLVSLNVSPQGCSRAAGFLGFLGFLLLKSAFFDALRWRARAPGRFAAFSRPNSAAWWSGVKPGKEGAGAHGAVPRIERLMDRLLRLIHRVPASE